MPNELSGGMRKRAGFARALVLDPEIVLFDEPDSGLDPVRTALLCELIKEVHAENGGCYVVITHDIMSARRVAEHISVLWKGRIVESGPGGRSCSPPRTRSSASSSPANRPARSAWSRPATAAGSADSASLRSVTALARLSALAGGAARRPRLVLAIALVLGLARRGARAAAAPDGGDRHVRVELELRIQGHAALLPELRRRAGRGAGQGQPAAAGAELGHRAAGRAWRAACRATCPRSALRERGRGRTGPAGSSRARTR